MAARSKREQSCATEAISAAFRWRCRQQADGVLRAESEDLPMHCGVTGRDRDHRGYSVRVETSRSASTLISEAFISAAAHKIIRNAVKGQCLRGSERPPRRAAMGCVMFNRHLRDKC
ncbi:hypothetical protein TNCV_517161 [Trichonephila clavipes]|nr:hypothetical protein TNCV_517161 [Trichonephila clavipes]